MSDQNKSPEEIRAEIEETRERISEDIDELGYRLGPEGLRDRAQETIHEAQDALYGATRGMTDSVSERAEKLSSGLVDRIRDNPLPATILGAGIGWLLLQGARSEEEEYTEREVGRGVVERDYAERDYGVDTDTDSSIITDSNAGRTNRDPSRRRVVVPGESRRGSGVVLGPSGSVTRVRRSRKRDSSVPDVIQNNAVAIGLGVLVAGVAVGLLTTRSGSKEAKYRRPRALPRPQPRTGMRTTAEAFGTPERFGETFERPTAARPDSTQTAGSTRHPDTYSFAADQRYFEQHHEDHYAGQGSFSDYEPAYRFGTSIAADDAFTDRHWEEIEAEVRERWEDQYTDTWNSRHEAIRYGFDRGRMHL